MFHQHPHQEEKVLDFQHLRMERREGSDERNEVCRCQNVSVAHLVREPNVLLHGGRIELVQPKVDKDLKLIHKCINS